MTVEERGGTAEPAGLIPTGSDAFDVVLGGGLPTGSLTILAGAPGTGKTVIAQQAIFTNAARGLRTLYLTTFSEPLPKLVHYLERFAFHDPNQMFRSVVYRDLGDRVRAEGVTSLPRIVAALVDESRCDILVIDSFKALHDLTSRPEEFRLAVFDTAAHLSATGVTSLWLGEYASQAIEDLPEFAVADGIIQFANRTHGVRDERSLRVIKMRGARTQPGEHTFSITREGVQVFPRLVELESRSPADDAAPERIRSGVDGFDEIAGGGLWRGTTTLVLAPSGSGKTMFGLSFLVAGTLMGEAGLLLTMQEDRRTMRHIVAGIAGDDLLAVERLLTVEHRSPLEADLVDIAVTLKQLILSRGVKRLVLDALGDLRDAAIDPSRMRAMIYNLGRFCAEHEVTMLINSEVPLNVGFHDHGAISSMSDNVLLLEHVAAERSITVVKMRRSAHDGRRHHMTIDGRGLHIGKPFRTGPGRAPDAVDVPDAD